MKHTIAIIAATFAFSAQAAFVPNMTTAQLNQEVAMRAVAQQPLSTIATAAKNAGYCTSTLQSALVSSGFGEAQVFNALVTAGCDASGFLPPTAAGNNNAGGSFNGLSNSAFGQSRATSVGGGGRTSVSPS